MDSSIRDRAKEKRYDAIVVGSGPNGLAAAIELGRAGWSVLVLEARDSIGGGMRTQELTLPGFRHDVCSAVHPLGVGSPFFAGLPLREHGLEWIFPEAELAHPLDAEPAVLVRRSVEETARGLGSDGAAYLSLMRPLAEAWPLLSETLLGPPLRPTWHLLPLAVFGLRAMRSARGLAEGWFQTERARAVFAGMAGHSILALERPFSASFGLLLSMLAHAHGWPIPKGGSASIAEALASYLRSLGGEILTAAPVQALRELPEARAIVFDLTPRQVLRIAGDAMPAGYRRALESYRYGPGAFKMDFALDGPIPWTDPACRLAATVHLGGTLAEIAESERAMAEGRHAERPYVLVAQQSLFDSTRAPAGRHTAWAYCHAPNGSDFDMSERILGQFERFAPGFRDRILARHTFKPSDYERYNANYVGGDINGGTQDVGQIFARPRFWRPYEVPGTNLYLCSSATPPGGGVHGMCGRHAARAVLARSPRSPKT